MHSITQPSRRLAFLFRTIFYAYPLAMLGAWLWIDPTVGNDWLDLDLIESVMEGYEVHDITTWQRLACFGASMLTGCATMYVFHALSRLFNLYGRGIFFNKENVACYRATGIGLILQQFFSLPEGALQTVILSWTNAEGERILAVNVDDANISLIVVGLMVILISRIMDEGRKMQEEQQLTV